MRNQDSQGKQVRQYRALWEGSRIEAQCLQTIYERIVPIRERSTLGRKAPGDVASTGLERSALGGRWS